MTLKAKIENIIYYKKIKHKNKIYYLKWQFNITFLRGVIFLKIKEIKNNLKTEMNTANDALDGIQTYNKRRIQKQMNYIYYRRMFVI